jgi:glycerol-3-phosphate acyltransferase PlsX
MRELLSGPVALDAMGGDYAPAVTVQGALAAVEQHGVGVLLVGRESLLRRELARHGRIPRGIEIVDAPDVVGMDEAATTTLRGKRQSSMAVALELVRDGRAAAFVSAGNTGAAWVAAKRVLGTIAGVERPALAAVLPGVEQQTLLVDAGANVDCKPNHLMQFGIMGHFYSQEVLGVTEPRLGLLSIGEEPSKGNALTFAAYSLLADTGLRFIGNVEGRDVYDGTVDVVVCDGFVGNVVLKVSEGLGEMVRVLLKQEARQSAMSAVGFLIAKRAFSGLRRRFDYAEVGGAPLLGVRGPCLIGHGRSNPKAIRNAIRFAHLYACHDVVRLIETKIADVRSRNAEEGG